MSWPVTDVDTIVRMRALAAALPHVALEECVFEAPFEAVWGIVGDLENGVPRFESGVHELVVTARYGDELEVVSRQSLGISIRFRVVLRPGWCVMHSRFLDIGMAVAPEADGRTRFAHFEGARWLGRAGRPLFRRSVRGDFRTLERLLAGRDTLPQ